MAECRYYDDCVFLKSPQKPLPPLAFNGVTARYCKDDHAACARYLIATIFGRHEVPPDLAPHESHRALKLMRTSQQEE